ncbi:hypothetical protein NLI96_g2240 [Meripilus lineatus]|uniref:DUF6533 domain-containing protein n=1 Tax=Meripilus lineatus TaxID=2056292 RepID=A0AAD5VDH0_9APHY|nr:hypothetical protein NLI96_g2240 [Physisporinus lineatus]
MMFSPRSNSCTAYPYDDPPDRSPSPSRYETPVAIVSLAQPFSSLFPSFQVVAMSQDDPKALAALIAQKMDEMTFANCCGIAATTLLYFDCIITFEDEIKYIWQRKFTGATVVCCINRYVTLAYRTLMIIQILPWHDQPKATGLRYYYTIIRIVIPPPPFTGCAVSVDLTTPVATFFTLMNEVVSIFGRAHAIFYDALVLVLTWIKTIWIKRTCLKLGVKASLTTLLLRDGTIYFLLLLMLNVCNVVAIRFGRFGALPAITEVITSILISRFIINLREVYICGDRDNTTLPISTKFTSVRFADNIVGNLGAPLGSKEESTNFLTFSTTHDGPAGNISNDPLMEFLPMSPSQRDTPTDEQTYADDASDDYDDDIDSVIDIKPGIRRFARLRS